MNNQEELEKQPTMGSASKMDFSLWAQHVA